MVLTVNRTKQQRDTNAHVHDRIPNEPRQSVPKRLPRYDGVPLARHKHLLDAHYICRAPAEGGRAGERSDIGAQRF